MDAIRCFILSIILCVLFPYTNYSQQIASYALLGDLENVKKCVANGVDVNYTDKNYKETPLEMTINSVYNNIDVVKYLVENGATNLEKALLSAAGVGKKEIVEYFIDKGVDTSKMTFELWANLGFLENVQQLYKEQKISQENINESFRGSVSTKYFQVAKYLLEKGADIDQLYYHGQRTVLDEAAKWGDFETVKFLVENGATGLNSALPWAAYRGSKKIILYLLVNGADVNGRNNWGQTALMELYTPTKTDLAKSLISKGADVNLQNVDGGTVIMSAAVANNIKLVKYLIGNGADVNLKNVNGQTALTYAIFKGHKNMIDLLIKNGADINLSDENGESGLSKASFIGWGKVVEYLRSIGAE